MKPASVGAKEKEEINETFLFNSRTNQLSSLLSFAYLITHYFRISSRSKNARERVRKSVCVHAKSV